ncbi:MAG: diaminopimelate epimerase, partial [Desulfobacteraceae bacterium]|nr:diaminopimelate epimerase [Desulfobacteraceae bacterium]
MKKIPFVKYTLCGNKFVIVDEIKEPVLTESEKPKFAFHATDICYGVGSDNFLVVQPYNPKVLKSINDSNNYWDRLPDSKDSDYIFRMFEPDGSEAYSCGNGLMCISDYLYRRYGILSARVMTEIPTSAPKILTIGTDLQQNLNWSNMGHPGKIPREIINSSVTTPYDNKVETIKDIKIEFPSNELNVFKKFSSLTLSGFLVFTGEPHLVVFTDTGFSEDLSEHIFTLSPHTVSISKNDRSRIELSSRLVHQIGMAFNEDYTHYFPKGININFVRVLQGSGIIEFRSFERGINRETWACGTGAVAAAYIAKHLNMITTNEITLWPYLSRLRDHDAKLRVIKKENDYFLQGNSVFLFEGNYPFNENTNKMPIRDRGEDHVQSSVKDNIQPPAKSVKNGKFLSGNPVLLCRGVYPFEDIINTIYHISVRKPTQDAFDLEKEESVEVFQQTYITSSARFKLITGTIILLIFALCFNALLSMGSLKKLYLNSVISRHDVIGKGLQQHIEELPENFETFTGINRILEDTKDRITRETKNTVSVSVALGEGLIQYSTDQKLIGASLPKQVVFDDENVVKKKDSSHYTKYEENYIVALPVRYTEKKQPGIIAIIFSEKQIKDIHADVFNKNIIIIALIISCSMVFLILFDALILSRIHTQKFPKKRIFTAIFIAVVLSQIIFSSLNINSFKNHYLQINRQDTVEHISKGNIFGYLQDIILDSLTILIISVFFFVEMLILFLQLAEKRLSGDKQEIFHYSAIRPAFFLLMFGLDLSISFIPLHMDELYKPLSGLSKDMVLSLPVSVFVFFSGISFLVAGIWNDRRGWHEPFFTGIVFAGTGLLYAWLAPNSAHFIISRAISGMGYGLLFMASQGFIISYTEKDTRAQGFALLFAALYAGNICGSASGAMIAERVGYKPVFFIGAIIVFSAIAYTVIFMQDSIITAKNHIEKRSAQSVSMRQIFNFLSDKNVITLILFSSIPANMAMIGFLEYF